MLVLCANARGYPVMSSPPGVSGVVPSDVELALSRIRASPALAASERLQRFLTYVVHETLNGRSGEIKEYVIGTRVYDRGDDFDPSRDSIVRTEAARLRKRLEAYYQHEGMGDTLRISLPRGAYVPHFDLRPGGGDDNRREPQRAERSKDEIAVSPGVAGPTGSRSRRAYVAVAAALVVGSALSLAGLRSAPTNPTASARPFVLVGEFANRSGNGLLDGAVESVLELELGRTQRHQPLPRPRIDDVFRLMGRPANTPLTNGVAEEVGVRDGGVHGVIAGSVHRLGNRYVFTARIKDPLDGHVLGTLSSDGTEADLLASIRDLSRDVIRSLDNVQGTRVDAAPVERVTSPSLRAIKLYSQANQAGFQGAWASAESLLRLAIAEDGQFASAHLLLAWSLRNQRKPVEQWKPPLNRALELAAQVSEIEQLFITGSAHTIEGRSRDAASIYETLLRLSPNHYWAANNLLIDSARLGSPDAAALASRLVQLQPNSFRTHHLAASTILGSTGNAGIAEPFARRARELARDADEAVALVQLNAWTAWTRGDFDQSVSLVRSAPPVNAVRDGRLYALRIGLLLAGMGIRSRADEALGGLGGDLTYRWQGWLALAAEDAGGVDRCALPLVDGYPNALNAILLARTGRVAEAQRLIDRAGETRGRGYESSLFEPIWNVARAEVLMGTGDTERAEALLDASRAVLGRAQTLLPEYFIAAARQGDLLARRGQREGARQVLTQATEQWRRAFGAPLLMWAQCARQLVVLEEQLPATGPSRWRPLVDGVLAYADEGFPRLPPLPGPLTNR